MTNLTKVLTALAKKVMGATIRSRAEGRVVIADFPDGTHYYIWHQQFGPHGGLAWWNPFKRLVQAVDLAEAWRKSDNNDIFPRNYMILSPRITKTRSLFEVEIVTVDGSYHRAADTCSEALTLAVCAAEKIKAGK